MQPIVIVVDPQHGSAVPEAQIVPFVDRLIAEADTGLIPSIGSNELIAELRVRVKRKEINVIFVFNGVDIPVMADGRLPHWPEGFPGDHHDRQLSELLDWDS